MKKALLMMSEDSRDKVYGEPHVASLRQMVDLEDCCSLTGDLDALRPHLAHAEIICACWGMMAMDEPFLEAAPELRAVFYGAGSVRGMVNDAFWDRGILLTNAAAANAIPVAETTVALIVLCARKAFQCNRLTKQQRTWALDENIQGLYGARIGVIGAGMIGRRVLEALKGYEVDTFCCDPFLSDGELRRLGATPLDMAEMFKTCDVVTLHAPNIPANEHMITGEHFRSMKDGAVFINTARARLTRQDELIEELKRGRIFACIDVTDPEPPEPDSPLYDLPNVFLTPHSSGAGGSESRRMGACVVEEVRRYCNQEPPECTVTRDMMEWMA